MKIIFMGTPDFACPILEALNEKYEVSLVISQPNRSKKKGQYIDTPVAALAKSLGLNLFQPETIKEHFDYIKSFEADVLVTAAYGQYVPTKILNLFKKCLNVHGSLLPKYRGGAPIQRAIINGENVTGVTIMEMTKKLDAGVMYAKKECIITNDDTASDIFSKLSIMGRDLLLEVIEDVVNNKIIGQPQNETEATYAPNLLPEEEIVNFNQPAIKVVRQINGLSNNPGASIIVGDMKIKVLKAAIVNDETNVKPGTIISLKKQVLVKAEDEAVSLDLILVPGKKVLASKDFVNGQKIFKELDVI